MNNVHAQQSNLTPNNSKVCIQLCSRDPESLVFRNYILIINYLEDVIFQTEFENTCFYDSSIFIITTFDIADDILKNVCTIDLRHCPLLKGREFNGLLPRLCEIITVNVEFAGMDDNMSLQQGEFIMERIRRLMYIPNSDFEYSRNMIEVYFGSRESDAYQFIQLIDQFNYQNLGDSMLKAYLNNKYRTLRLACDFNIDEVPRSIEASYSKINVWDWIFGNKTIRNGLMTCEVKVPIEVCDFVLGLKSLHVNLPGGGLGEVTFFS